MQYYTIACECGQFLLVTAGDCGSRQTCVCGREVEIPPFRELRSVPVPEVASPLIAQRLVADKAPPKPFFKTNFDWPFAILRSILHFLRSRSRAGVKGFLIAFGSVAIVNTVLAIGVHNESLGTPGVGLFWLINFPAILFTGCCCCLPPKLLIGITLSDEEQQKFEYLLVSMVFLLSSGFWGVVGGRIAHYQSRNRPHIPPRQNQKTPR